MQPVAMVRPGNAKPSKSMQKYSSDQYFEMKSNIHDRLLELLDISQLDTIDDQALKTQISIIIEGILKENKSGRRRRTR